MLATKALVNALVNQERDTYGISEAEVARRIAPGVAHFQSKLHKFCHGGTTSPAHSTAALIADHYGIPVQALYDERLAEQIAQARGLSITRGSEEKVMSEVNEMPQDILEGFQALSPDQRALFENIARAALGLPAGPSRKRGQA